ncbi:MAG: DUF1223 domain-containing protein [Dongiaceae bacterium]
MKRNRRRLLHDLARKSLTAAATIAVLAGGAVPAHTMEPVTDAAPVVIELYTSQGCSSCPPADAYLGELAQRRDVLALAFHVDYWNYIGWADPFSSPEATARQRAYARFLNERAIYTPQMVVDGAAHEVGSNRAAVAAAIKAAALQPKTSLLLVNDDSGGYRIVIGEAEDADASPDEPAIVWLVEYDQTHVTSVKRGENTGKTLTEYNIVRAFRPIGEWDGSATEIALPPAETDAEACAVIVQADPVGPVYAAAAFALE